MRLVPVECVREGSFLAKTIFDDNNRVLLREGVKLTQNLIRGIKNIGIYTIYINDEYSESIVEDIVKPELRQKAVKAIKDTFCGLGRSNDNYYSMERSSSKKENINQKHDSFESISDIANEIIEQVLDKKNVLVGLVDIKSLDNYTYQHCVNVAILSLILGIKLELGRTELYNLCMGALVHDIGKILIPKEIIQKKGPLTKEEYEIVKKHCEKGYEYLAGSIDISSPSRIIVLEHHEKVDGSGYPDHRKGDEINKLARIVAIADVYDALTSDRPYRRALSPNEAVEYVMAGGQRLFDYKMVKTFSKTIIPYPEGTLVKLSNGKIGCVERIVPDYLLRPVVRIIDTENKKKGLECIDLTKNLNVVIEGIVYNAVST